MGIFHTNLSGLNGPDTPRGGPKQHNVASQTLNRKIFVDRADNGAIRFGYDRIGRGFRNGATRG